MFFKIKNQKGYALLIVLIVVAIIALIFFAKGNVLDKYKNGYKDEDGNQQESVEKQLEGIEGNMDAYNERVKGNLE